MTATWLLAALLLAGCGVVAVPGDLPKGDTEIARTVTASCSRPLYCGAIGYVDCHSPVDGPAYYFERRTGRIIGRCGGTCMSDQSGRCERECPPRGWRCGRRGM